MIHSYCKRIAMLSWHILFKGDGKEEILAALNLAVVFFFLHISMGLISRMESSQSFLRDHFKSKGENTF